MTSPPARRPYPPSPWSLRGRLHLTVWRVPGPVPTLPHEVTPLRIGGSALAGTAWVIYEPGGVLSYRELLAAVLVRVPGSPVPAVSITDIWVDDDTSRRGGRELWAIPKDMASFRVDGPGCAAWVDDRVVAAGTVRPSRVWPGELPGRWAGGFTVVQDRAGTLVRTPVRSVAGVQPITTNWEFAADGPLAWLRDARRLGSVSLADFEMVFGASRL